MSAFDNILIIGKVWPEPNSSAAGSRMMQLIQFFKEKKTILTFACTANPSQFQVDLEEYGIPMVQITLNSETFDDFIKDLNPTLVVFDRFMTEEQYGWRVMEHCPDAFRILNTEDMHFLRDARGDALRKNKTIDLNKQSDLESSKCFREIASIYRSDLSLLVSEIEIEMLKNTFQIPEHLLYYMPLFASEETNTLPEFEERSDFMFIGNFLHEPNWDALRHLSEDIWPLIRKAKPKAILNVYGAYPTQKVMQLHQPKKGFLVHGRVDDATEVTLKTRVSLAPIRFGAGIKGKLIEAMVCGTPNITTPMGAEGMNYSQPWNGSIESTDEAFAEQAVELYSNKEKWNQAQINGFKIVKDRFLAKNHLPQFNKKLENVGSNLSAHRSKDFTSKLLQQEFVMGMKYFSMWISEKDKKN